MKKYVTPDFQVVEIEKKDIISTSCTQDAGGSLCTQDYNCPRDLE